MFLISRWLWVFHSLLLCRNFATPPAVVECRMIFSNASSNETDDGAIALSILDNEWKDFVFDDETTIANCTMYINGTNITICENFTSTTNTTMQKRDHFKFLFVSLIPILIKVAIIIINILKFVLSVAKIIAKVGYAVAKVVGKFAFKAITYAIKYGKMVGKYVIKAGRIMLETYDVAMAIKDTVDPVMEYYKAQEEAKRLAAEEERLRQEDLVENRQQWQEQDGNDVPPDVGQEPEWEPQRKPSLLHYDDEVEDSMPGWVIALIVITLVALIVAMPTAAFIITTRRRRRRRRAGKTERKATSKATKRRKKTSKKGGDVSKKSKKSPFSSKKAASTKSEKSPFSSTKAASTKSENLKKSEQMPTVTSVNALNARSV